MSVRFSFQEMLTEVRAFAGLADDFIAKNSKDVLPRFLSDLEGYRNAPTERLFDWEIPNHLPLTTIGTKGYEPKNGGHELLIGEISVKWRIKKEQPKKKSMRATHFKVAGIASTRIRLKCVGPDDRPAEELAMWRMEIADRQSPGCFFHSQILGESDRPPFPHSVPVPRLPTIAMTPAAVAEFAFGELFQDEWGPRSALQVPHLNRWAPIQRRRLDRLLGWKLAVLQKTSGSPWWALKTAQPDEDIFL